MSEKKKISFGFVDFDHLQANISFNPPLTRKRKKIEKSEIIEGTEVDEMISNVFSVWMTRSLTVQKITKYCYLL